MKYRSFILFVALAVFTKAEATAAQITLEISGHITSVDPLLTLYYAPNTPIAVTLSYLTGQPYAPGNGFSDYSSLAAVSADGHDLNGSGYLRIKDNQPYDEAIFGYIPLSGFPIAPFETPTIYIGFIDYDSAIFSDSSLPNPFPSLPQWDGISSAFITYLDTAAGNTSRQVFFTIDQMTVPEPSSALLLVFSGLFPLVVARFTRLNAVLIWRYAKNIAACKRS